MKLPLFPDPTLPPERGGALTAVEATPPRAYDDNCTRCALAMGCKSVCIKPSGQLGGILLVGAYPGRREDEAGKAMVGEMGAYVKSLVDRYTKEPILVDNAIRCAPGARKPPANAVDQCRGYLARTIELCKPKRIIAMGSEACRSVFGRSVSPMSARRGFAYMPKLGIPVFITMLPAAAQRNPFLKKWLEADMKWALTGRPPFDAPWHGTYEVISSAEEAQAAAAELRRAPWVAFDGEWAGRTFDPDFTVLDVGLSACDQDHGYVWDRAALALPAARAVLLDLLSDPGVKKGGHNAKADMVALGRGLGIEVQGLHLDTQIVRHLLETDVDAALDDCAELVGMGGYKAEAEAARARGVRALGARRKALSTGSGVQLGLLDGGGDGQFGWMSAQEIKHLETVDNAIEDHSFALIPNTIRSRYNARDVVCTGRVGLLVEDELAAKPHLQRHWDNLVRDAIVAYSQIETWGVRCDRTKLEQLCDYVGIQDDQALREFNSLVNLPPNTQFNIDSNDQLAELLFDKLGLHSIKKTESGAPSVDEEALSALRGRHPCIDPLLEHRRLGQFKKTYAGKRLPDGRHQGGLIEHIQGDERIHTEIKIDGARSGRTSSVRPNLQNITKPDEDAPQEKPEGKMLRDCFVASPGNVLIDIDFKQLEYRVAAAISGDPEMLKAIMAGDDFHLETAKLISQMMWGIPPEQVGKQHRRPVKAINFGLFYGKTDDTLADELGISVADAAKVRSVILGKFKKLDEKIRWAQALAKREGVARTWWNGQLARERQLYKIASPDPSEVHNALNAAFNTLCQGTGNDVCMRAVVDLVAWIRKNKHPAKVVLTVHDSVLSDCPKPLAAEFAAVAASIMRSVPANGVPLDVDVEVGESWGSLEKMKVAA